MSSYKTKLSSINTFIFDVDGVLTDSTVILDSSGEMVRTMNTRDGFAMQYAVKNGYNVCIITGGNSPMVKQRLEYLGINDVYLAATSKTACLEDYINRKGINLSQVLYMGDDLPDFSVMKQVGLPACPKDAATEILQIAEYVSHYDGGKGCVRDVIEQTLRAKGNWPSPS
ncbi:HAD-IIIA family hydrolase [Flavobacteriales bacterium]|jgi:3-deoxy-D-manno-octulosonate 8-phosphate phosphatase (KDO 8-P phosphatase)|nr:HAD-IIIA family hydrolase [Flavobacteriales bacterium]